jgi:hypothetical protein
MSSSPIAWTEFRSWITTLSFPWHSRKEEKNQKAYIKMPKYLLNKIPHLDIIPKLSQEGFV